MSVDAFGRVYYAHIDKRSTAICDGCEKSNETRHKLQRLNGKSNITKKLEENHCLAGHVQTLFSIDENVNYKRLIIWVKKDA